MMNTNDIRVEVDKYLEKKFKCLLSEKETIKDIRRCISTHGESMNKLKTRVNELESKVSTFKSTTIDSSQPSTLLSRLESIDESLKFIKSHMSIEIYEPYSTHIKHINPFFKED